MNVARQKIVCLTFLQSASVDALPFKSHLLRVSAGKLYEMNLTANCALSLDHIASSESSASIGPTALTFL